MSKPETFSVEIKRLYSLDLPGVDDLPEDPSHCWIRVNADIGTTESPAADTFRIIVCTPRALERKLEESVVAWGTHLLVVECFDWQVVEAALIERINSCADKVRDWEEFARLFGQHAGWEFDD